MRGHWSKKGSDPFFPDSLRIDRWLHCCRFFKTRSKATATVTGGHVRLSGERAAPEAQACYVEDEASVRAREAKLEALRQDRLLMPGTEGRPDKRTRSKLRQWRGR